MAMNKKAGALASVAILVILTGIASLILGFIYAPLGTFIGVGITIGVLVVLFFSAAGWMGLYSLFGGVPDELGK